jgi:hypothetical protein
MSENKYLKTSYELAQPKTWLSSKSLIDEYGQLYTAENPLLVMQTAQLDINNDGLDDLFTYASYPLNIPTPNPPPIIFLNSGGMLKKQSWNGPILKDPHGVKILVGDFNGDYLPDLFSLVAVDLPIGNVSPPIDFNNILFNSPVGFNKVKEFDDQLGFWYAGASGDIDNDGDLDVVMFNFLIGTNGVKNQILWNDGLGNFTYDSKGVGDIAIVDQAELRDVNRDGYLDLVLDHIDTKIGRTPIISVMWGNGKGFSEDREVKFNLFSNDYVSNICFADLNSDNKDEIIVSGDNSAGKYWIKIFCYDEKITSYSDVTTQFIEVNVIGKRFDHIRVNDIDGDGLTDIFSPDKSDGIRWEWSGSKFLKLDPAVTKFWKDNTKAPTDTKKADAVNLTDAIAILKMIVGLNVNSNNTPLSPYQAIAADFDQSGDVGLTDAIGVLKMVVGLSAPTPTWKYYDDTKLNSAYTSAQSLNPKGWTTTAAISDTGMADSSVKLVGVLTGDVDGSWTGV